jgi:TonB family protein
VPHVLLILTILVARFDDVRVQEPPTGRSSLSGAPSHAMSEPDVVAAQKLLQRYFVAVGKFDMGAVKKLFPGMPDVEVQRITALARENSACRYFGSVLQTRSQPEHPSVGLAEASVVEACQPKRRAQPTVRSYRASFTLSGTPGSLVIVDQSQRDVHEVLRVGGDVPKPKRVEGEGPAYPPDAQAARVQGTVAIEMMIGTDGRVVYAYVVRSVPMLDEAALATARRWRFEPTLVNGVPVPVVCEMTVNFRLE